MAHTQASESKSELTVPSNSNLSTTRQKFIVRGIRERLAQFAVRSGESSLQAESEFAKMQREFEGAMGEFEAKQKSALAKQVTDWDERVDAAWIAMEKTTFKSVQQQDQHLKNLLAQMRAEREKEIKQHKQTRTNYQNEYDTVKHHPQKRLERKKVEWNARTEKNGDAFMTCQQLLVARSLRIPNETLSPIPEPEISSLAGAMERMDQLQREIEAAYQEMRFHSAARWSEGWKVWAIGVVAGGIAAAIAYQMKLAPLVWPAVGVGTAFCFSILLLLGLRPAIAKKARQVFPKAKQAWESSQKTQLVANRFLEQECVAEQNRLRDEFKQRIDKLDADHQARLQAMQAKLDEDSSQIRAKERAKRTDSAEHHTQLVKGIHAEEKPRLESLVSSQQLEKTKAELEHQETLQHLQKSFRQSLAFVKKRFEKGVEFAKQAAALQCETVRKVFPNWEDVSYWEANELVRANTSSVIPLGTMKVEIGDQDLLKSQDSQKLEAVMPLLFRLVEDGCLTIEASSNHRALAQETIRNLLVRALSSLPAGGFQVTIIDPDGLGKDYAWLMHLADSDPKMVNYRVWTQANHIAEQLGRLTHHTEDVIQQLLRDRYRDIREYNRDAGSMAEPYRLVVWSRFPVGLDENSWRFLSSLIASGGRCGVSVILQLDPSLDWPMMGDSRRMDGLGMRLKIEDASPSSNRSVVRFVEPDFRDFAVELDAPPSESRLSQLLQKCAAEAMAGSRVEVPFATLMPLDEPMGTASSADGLVIPLGQAGVGRMQFMKLGQGTAQHVLIAGKTGSGKSSLLHTMVTSAALKYAPDQLRLVLLDFKKGVEFQAYSEAQIPHTDIIGIESQREFGLSTLEYLDRVMQKRGELFRSAGVQDVGSWVRRNPTLPMPRILVVVDEFQELFVEDDKLAQQASMLLDRIVRQGRSFGMHVVLASQTLGGSYSLPRTTLAQMAVRIALQCEGSDAMIILSEDNLAAERLRHAGQAVYNDASGRVEGNQPFQVAYISKDHQQMRLAQIPAGVPFVDESNNSLGHCVVFEGHRAANWDTNAVEQAMELLPSRENTSVAAVIGDSVSIEPAVAVQVSRQAGRNFLVVGSEDRNAADCMATLLGTIFQSARHRLGVTPGLAYLDGSRPDDQYVARIPRLVRLLRPDALLGDVRTSTAIVNSVYEELQKRSAAPEEPAPPFLFVVSQLGRFRELRKSDEFSFGSDDSGVAKPDVQLQEILRDGPGLGIHSILWADNWNTLSRVIARQSMHDLELRILMQMSSNDSNHLIDSPLANRLDSHVLLIHDEATGLSRKFRPYRIDDFQEMVNWVNP